MQCCHCKRMKYDKGWFVDKRNVRTPSCRMCACLYSDAPKKAISPNLESTWTEKIERGDGVIIVTITKDCFNKMG